MLSAFFWLFSLLVALSYRIKIKKVRGDENITYANENILVCLCTKNILLLKFSVSYQIFLAISGEICI